MSEWMLRNPSSGYPALNSPSLHPVAADPLHRLTRRIRWKRWLSRLHRFAWIIALGFLLLYGADCLIGLRTLSMRIASAVAVVLAMSLFALDMIAAWLV